jgi:hypothetical protein
MSLPSLILLLPRVTSLLERISAWFQDTSRSPAGLAPILQELEEVATLLPEESFRHRFVEIVELLNKQYHTRDEATGESMMLRMILDSGFIHDSELIDDIKELLEVSLTSGQLLLFSRLTIPSTSTSTNAPSSLMAVIRSTSTTLDLVLLPGVPAPARVCQRSCALPWEAPFHH